MTDDEYIGYLVERGALIVSGMENDLVVYNMVPDVMKEVDPELYKVMISEVNEALLGLYEAGLVNVEYDENLNALFTVTEEGARLAEEMLRNAD